MKEARQADLFGEMSESPEAQRPVRRKKGSDRKSVV